MPLSAHPFRWPVCAAPAAALVLCALLAPGEAARAQPATGNERMSQQLRDAIERANSQRPAASSRPAKGDAASAPTPTPSVTLNVGQGGALRVVPTAPVPPASAPVRRLQVPVAPGDDEVAAPRPPPRSAGASARTAADVPRSAALPPSSAPPTRPRASDDQVQRQYERARAIALGLPIPVHARLVRDGDAAVAASPPSPSGPPGPPPPWSYSGPGGPQAWGRLQPGFQLCGTGQRQSPIHIEDTAALQGPNEALAFDYRPSGGTVVHDGRTIRVDVEGDNLLQVRGGPWRLESFDFQHPAEEMVNHNGFAMGMHLMHRNAQGQLAIVAVLLQPGEPSAFIDRVWTYLPLDAGDTVRMPAAWLDLSTLLPRDQRYYQFFGSLTRPPCTEGVLWMVLKQPVTLSADQLRLFAQMFPANARPVQALNGRIVRDAQ